MQRLYHSLGLKTERNLPAGHQIQAPFSFGMLHTAFHKRLKLYIVTRVLLLLWLLSEDWCCTFTPVSR